MDDDITLMLRVKEGDLASFEQLYQRYTKPITNFYLRLGCGIDTSEDYVQEVFMRIWRARNNYEPRAKFTTFLFQVAKNFWINEHQKKKRRPVTYNLDQETESKNLTIEEAVAHNDKPDDKILSGELNEKIHNAIQQLDDTYRLVFVLSEFEDLKYKEIAEILEIPIGTVKSRMATAEKKLRDKLKKYLKTDD